MAISGTVNSPTYSKPKKPKRPKQFDGFSLNVGGVGAAATPKAITPPKPGTGAAATAVAPRTAAPTAAAPAAFGSFTPPATGQGARQRSTAESTYQAAIRTSRQGIVDAALRLGSPEVIAALKADPNFAEYASILDKGTADPSSQFAQAAKDETQNLDNIDTNANAGNTFFSGKRLTDRNDLTDQFNTAKAGYLRDYTTGYNTLVGNMGVAKGDYDRDLFDADTMDYNDWLSRQPAPTGPDTQASLTLPSIPGMTPQQVQDTVGIMNGPSAGRDTTPNPGYQFVQTSGSRKGLSYNVKTIGGVKYRYYENGDKVKA